MDFKRYVDNPKLSTPIILETEQIKQIIAEKMNQFESNYEVTSNLMIKSNPKKSVPSYDIYCGSGGKAFLYFKLSRTDSQYQESFNKSLEASQNLLFQAQLTKQIKEDQTPLTFYFGDIGIYTLAAIRAADQNDKNLVNQHLQNMLTREQWIYTKITQDEILYGNSGYLYSFLLVYKYCEQFIENKKAVVNVCDLIIKQLIKVGWNARGILVYEFPRGQTPYIGGAHGTIGIIQTILLTFKMFPDLAQSTYEIENTLNYLVNLQFPSGNFPASLEEGEEDILIHFCHGAPAFAMTFCLAYEYFKNDKYLNSAIKAGESIWQKGLIRKGNGLCHGICGNAYAFLALYRTTNEEKWLQRAHTFAQLSIDPRINEAQASWYDVQRSKQGIPETPYSLMEGLAGEIAFHWDLLNVQNSAFPGYEL